MEQIPAWLLWLVGTAITIFGALASSAVLVAFLNRRWNKKDADRTLADGNKQAEISAESKLIDNLLSRITKLESDVSELNRLLSKEMADKARLEEQNKNMAVEIDRLRKRLADLEQSDIHRSNG